MEGELRCKGEERTAAACPAAALPTEPPNPPHLAASCCRVVAEHEEREGSLCCCRRAGGLAVGGAAATSSSPAKARRRPWRVVVIWVTAGGRELAQGVAGVARRCCKRHHTSGRQEVTLRSPFFCRRRCRGFWSMGMVLLLPEPPLVLPLHVSLKSESLWLLRKKFGAEGSIRIA
ncbi:hypothetical protein Ahy_B08g091042 [Arachis hypogaea]|uniref:Uncharacterized protein n=1 Tax=Arachis hypogaea TaxID=3818 RepID=A0A444Y1B2_ARAHY|nr:hypothetical protein Ahy_B08g091042 [Arachis hypogaea]